MQPKMRHSQVASVWKLVKPGLHWKATSGKEVGGGWRDTVSGVKNCLMRTLHSRGLSEENSGF